MLPNESTAKSQWDSLESMQRLCLLVLEAGRKNILHSLFHVVYIYIYPSPTPTGGVLASQSCMATPSSQTWLKIFISIYHPHVVGCRLGLKTSKTISSGLSLHGHYTLGEKLVHYNCRWLQLVHYNRPLQLTAREYTHMNDFGGYSRAYLNWYCLIQ